MEEDIHIYPYVTGQVELHSEELVIHKQIIDSIPSHFNVPSANEEFAQIEARASCRVKPGSDFSYLDISKCFLSKAIHGKEYLEEIEIPANVEILCEQGFSVHLCRLFGLLLDLVCFPLCTSLREIEIPANVAIIGDAFHDTTRIRRR